MKSDKKQTNKEETKTQKGVKSIGEIFSNMFNIFTGGMLRGKK